MWLKSSTEVLSIAPPASRLLLQAAAYFVYKCIHVLIQCLLGSHKVKMLPNFCIALAPGKL